MGLLRNSRRYGLTVLSGPRWRAGRRVVPLTGLPGGRMKISDPCRRRRGAQNYTLEFRRVPGTTIAGATAGKFPQGPGKANGSREGAAFRFGTVVRPMQTCKRLAHKLFLRAPIALVGLFALPSGLCVFRPPERLWPSPGDHPENGGREMSEVGPRSPTCRKIRSRLVSVVPAANLKGADGRVEDD